MKRWEIVTMTTGGVLLLGSALVVGTPPVNAVGAALVGFPPVLYLIRTVEERVLARTQP